MNIDDVSIGQIIKCIKYLSLYTLKRGTHSGHYGWVFDGRSTIDCNDIVVIIDINSLFIVCKTIDNKNLFVPIDMIVNFTQT